MIVIRKAMSSDHPSLKHLIRMNCAQPSYKSYCARRRVKKNKRSRNEDAVQKLYIQDLTVMVIEETTKWVATQVVSAEDPSIIDFTVLETCGTEADALYYCVVAENEDTGQLVGYALCTYNYMIWLGKSVFLENIFVLEEFRRKGLGNRLLASICQHGLQKGCVSMTYVSTNDDSRPFFEKHEFLDTTEKGGWLYYTMSKNGLESAARL